jgi:transcriptional regulator
MYIPRHFAANDRALVLEVMREHSFAVMISADDQGAPFATHLPLIISEREVAGESRVVIEGHFAKASPHRRYLEASPEALVIFSGPHAYMSPRVYPEPNHVPTWNYLAVHAYGAIRFRPDAEAKDELLKRLIALHEPPYAEQWRGLPEDFRSSLLSAIVAFEVEVVRLESKFKINQARPEAHAKMKEIYGTGTPDERALAGWMERLGL